MGIELFVSNYAGNISPMAIVSVLQPSTPYFLLTSLIKPPISQIAKYGTSLGPVKCKAVATNTRDDVVVPIRRSANYQPPIWRDDYIQSLGNDYEGGINTKRFNELKRQIKMMIGRAAAAAAEPLDQLELIDNLQRLGVSYHFQGDIKTILENIYHNINESDDKWHKQDIYAVSLAFRLLRQHGYIVSQEIFNSFWDNKGYLQTDHCGDTKGMLYLYEASHLAMEGESILDLARDLSAQFLKQKLDHEQALDQNLAILVQHALELPLHWRVPRLEARWFINVYEKSPYMNPILLEIAQLDFNIVQATHQSDLKYVSKWWMETNLGEKLPFARNCVVDNFLWTVGVVFEPQHGYSRRMLTKVNSLVTIIDDVYDVYGTLDELELFTNAIERWDVNAMDQLPDYMRICFLALYNSINEMGYDSLKEQGVHTIPYMRNGWAKLCKAYLQEAKWYFNGYTPTLKEYLDNAWISVSVPIFLLHSYFSVSNPITIEALEYFNKDQSIIRCSSMILRLADDLGTSSEELKRGDVPKSIQCYMNETGASEEDAREHIRLLIGETWKRMNEERVAHSDHLSKTFIGMAVNVARMSLYMYQHGDGHGAQTSEINDHILALLIDPIPHSPFICTSKC